MVEKTSATENTGDKNSQQDTLVKGFSVKDDIDPSLSEFLEDRETSSEKSGDLEEGFAEKIARKQGWVPQDEFDGDPEKWRPAVEYLEGAPLASRLKKQSQRLKELERVNNAAFVMLQKQTERYLQKEATEIQEQKRLAIEEGDVRKVEDLEKQYNNLLQEMPQPKANIYRESEESNPNNLEYKNFALENKRWFNHDTPKNSAMVQYADSLNSQLAEEYPDIPINVRLKEVEKQVKNEFFSDFQNYNRDRAPTVAPRSVKKVSSKVTFKDMPEDVRSVIRNFKIKNPKLNVDEYAQQLVESGAVVI